MSIGSTALMDVLDVKIGRKYVTWIGVRIHYGMCRGDDERSIVATKKYKVLKSEFWESELIEPEPIIENYRMHWRVHDSLFVGLREKMDDLGWPPLRRQMEREKKRKIFVRMRKWWAEGPFYPPGSSK